MSRTIPVARINAANPDHHLWDNHGTWWCHYTEHLPDFTKRRVRRSLGTALRDEAGARERRRAPPRRHRR